MRSWFPSGDLGSEEEEERPGIREKLPLPAVPRRPPTPAPSAAIEGGGVDEEPLLK